MTSTRLANAAATDVIAKKIRETVTDPSVANALIPGDLYAKRPLCCDGYYETYNRENVTLVDVHHNPIVEFTENGIRTEDGTEHELDVIILATGFDAVSGNQLKIEHKGRGGASLHESWKDRPRTHLGLMAHGFPNLYMIYGPMGPFTNQPPAHEAQVDWVARSIQYVRDHDLGSIEPTLDAENGWVAVEIKRIAGIDAVEQLTRYLERIRADPARAECRGVLAAQRFRLQALTLAESRAIRCVEVDLAVLRGEREPELTLFV